MRFGVQAWGSEGDVRPLIALAAGLRAGGHSVTITICSDRRVDYKKICGTYGLQYLEAGTYLDFADISAKMSQCADEVTWFRTWHRTLFIDGGNEDLMYDAAMVLCADNDVVISHYLSYPTKAAVLKSGTPHVSVQLTHDHTPTGFRSCGANTPNLGQRLNQITWNEVSRIQDTFFKRDYMRFWTGKGLPPFDHLRSLYFSDDLNLLGISNILCQQQPDWGDLHIVTGFLNLPESDQFPRISRVVEEFVATAEPPVFMTLGSGQEVYPGSNAENNADLFVHAALKSGCRAVIQIGVAAARKYPPNTLHAESNRILFVDWIPYDAILARSAMAVHHAGAGTSQLALRSDCPCVLLPPTAHHLTFAKELNRIGVAPKPVLRDGVSSRRLAAQISEVLSNLSYKERAIAVGPASREEDGVRRAVAVITERFGTPDYA